MAAGGRLLLRAGALSWAAPQAVIAPRAAVMKGGGAGMLVYVCTETGEMLPVECGVDATVGDLLQQIGRPRGVTITFQGTVLSPGMALSDASVCAESTLHLSATCTQPWVACHEDIDLSHDNLVATKRVTKNFCNVITDTVKTGRHVWTLHFPVMGWVCVGFTQEGYDLGGYPGRPIQGINNALCSAFYNSAGSTYSKNGDQILARRIDCAEATREDDGKAVAGSSVRATLDLDARRCCFSVKKEGRPAGSTEPDPDFADVCLFEVEDIGRDPMALVVLLGGTASRSESHGEVRMLKYTCE
eukprot:TRINITY_DN51155_c0_g1_i1.p1 TRINITY_DN51155_c0_g1~~TRINITY_DN51155_c0_g1_i1.p1  ORF type:complete len:325 (+),score=59.91 TRINITY_DN51155_c0_g1_i1:73-975(+)